MGEGRGEVDFPQNSLVDRENPKYLLKFD